MSKKSTVGLRARVVASRRTMGHRLSSLSARARQYGSDASSCAREILSACIAGAVPEAHLRPAVEPLENRQLLSTSVLAGAAPAAANQNVQIGGWTRGTGVELGAKFTSDVSGSITGVRFYKGSLNTGPHTGEVWSSNGTLLATASFTNETASGWQEADFSNPVSVTPGQVYVISYHSTSQYMSYTGWGLASEISNGSVHLLADGQSGTDGVFAYGVGSATFPTQGYASGNYWVDAVFSPGGTTTAPPVSPPASPPPASSGLSVLASYAPANPNVQIGGWTPGEGVELGAKFKSDVNGSITGVRFYKGSLDTGANTGEVWNSYGSLLATATFTNETASGWQQVNFSSPVAVTAGQVYVISYHSTSPYMAYTPWGLSSEINNGSLHLLADGQSGTDGVFAFGAASASFPSQGYLSGNYWVDAVFSPSSMTTTSVPLAPPPVSPPASPPPPPPPTVPSPNAPTASIAIQGGNGQAEHSVFVNGLGSPLGHGSQLTATYNWNFGDYSGGAYNNLTGWNASHIYDNPGTYTISLTVTNDMGLSSTAYTSVTITPSARTTIYVNTWGNDANNGLSANTPIASETRLLQLLNSYGNSNVSVLFARGETFNMPYYLYVEGSNESFGAYGSGNAPVLEKVASPTGDSGIFYMTSSANQIVIENLTFDSPYAAPANWAPDITATAIFPNGSNITVRNNTFLNLEDAMDCYQGPNGLLVENNSAPLLTGIRGYFVWMNGTNGVVLGNTVVNSTRQHVMRSNYSSTEDWLIAGNNFASGDNPADSGESSKTTINLRQGDHVYIADNTLSDDAVSFGPTEDMPTSAFVGWIKFDGNTVNNAQVQLHGSVQHAMVSNNLTNLSGIYAQYVITPTDDMGRQMLDVTLSHNTGIATGAESTYIDIEGNSPFGALTIENNLYSNPSLVPGYNLAASVFIAAPNANAVALFSHNVWAAASWQFTSVPGAVNYIAPAGVLQLNYLVTASQWDSMWNVQDDQFRQVSVSGSALQVAIDGQMAGAVLPAYG